MPFISPGLDIAMQANARTGRLSEFAWDASGNPTYADDRTHAVASLLMEHRGKWAQDATGTRGSELYKIKNDRARTASEIESAARDALEPLIRSGDIRDVVPYARRIGTGVYRLTVTYTAADGTRHSVEA